MEQKTFFLNRLSLRTRLIIGFAVPLVVLVSVVFIGNAGIQRVQDRFSQLSEFYLPVIQSLETMKFESSRLISSANEYVLDQSLGSEEGTEAAGAGEEAEDENAETGASERDSGERAEGERAEVEEALDNYNASFEQLRLLVNSGQGGDEDDDALLVLVDSAGQSLVRLANALLTYEGGEAGFENVSELREALETAEEEFLEAIALMSAEEQAALAEAQADTQAAVSTMRTLVIGIVLIGLVVAGGLGVLIYRSIADPIQVLQTAAERLRDGHSDAQVANPGSDEIGQFARTFNSMAAQNSSLLRELEQQLALTEAARAKAERSDQVKSAFLASMSHELRTPLNAVINFTQFVIDGDTGPVNQQQTELLSEVVGSSKHLLDLINDVLDMSKIEANSLRLFVEDNINLNAVLAHVIATSQGLLNSKQVRIIDEIEPALPLVRGDRQRLTQITLNIMSNACKFTEQGTIRVHASATDDEVKIVIADTGPGIPPDDHALVFEPFKQTNTGLRKGSGTGLGMPIAQRLAEAHGGSLWLESQPGHGTTFTLVLPVRSELLTPELV